ncbi:MAG TPA: polysaccharide biosynthesis protein [Gammaproteobacteria bacterium]|nr:polysaccharide biosynthesis protein [Gammaproteobacteria bacterium]
MTRRTGIVLHDLFMVMLAWVLAFSIRYNFVFTPTEWWVLAQSLPVMILAQGLVLWRFGLYRGVWRFASIPDLWNILRAVMLGTLAAAIALFLINRLDGIPRSSLVFYPMFLVFLLGGPRVIYRMWKDHRMTLGKPTERKRVLILGAGRAGEMLARDMHRDGEYSPVGFLDDQPKLKGAKIHGIPILGSIEDVARVVEDVEADAVVIAMPSASGRQMQRIVSLCERIDVPFRTLPRLQDMVSGRASISELREVAIDDLLGRDPVSLDWKRISAGLAGKTVLVSGGGGSIGAELCRQVAGLGPARLVIFERSEFNLYRIELELRRDFPRLILHSCLGDVADTAAVERVMDQHRPNVIFHAAAYKHVPLLERQPREALRNNVVGTKVLAMAADRFACSTFVLISTDKVVNPTNVMGASKRVAELFCQALNRRSNTRFITVRFGNVLGSAGSVVPLFQQQIAEGGPVTVTDPDISRFFMTIPEACQLIMQAAAMGRGGEIFVLDMGEPVKISYLAEQLIRLSGKVPGKDINITYTGLRPGEKLYEELFYEHEVLGKTTHEKILLAQSSVTDWGRLNQLLDALQDACSKYDEGALQMLLRELVPEMSEAPAGKVAPAADNVVRLPV